MQKRTAQKRKEIGKDTKTDVFGGEFPRLLSKTLSAIRENWHLSILNILVDLVFLFLLSFSTVYFSVNAMEHATNLMEMGGEMTGGLTNIYNQTEQVSAGLLQFQHSADVNYEARQVMKYMLYILLTALLVWVVLQGISWYIAYRISNEKERRIGFLTFIKNFALQTIPFYLAYCVLILILIITMVKLATSLFPAISTPSLNIIFYVIAIILAYFWFLSYTFTASRARDNLKSAFRQGALKFKRFIRSVCFIIFIIMFLDFLLIIPVMTENVALTIILGVLIFAAILAGLMMLPQTTLMGFVTAAAAVVAFVLFAKWKAGTYFDTIDPFYYITVGLLLFLLTVFFSRILLFKTRQEYAPIAEKK